MNRTLKPNFGNSACLHNLFTEAVRFMCHVKEKGVVGYIPACASSEYPDIDQFFQDGLGLIVDGVECFYFRFLLDFAYQEHERAMDGDARACLYLAKELIVQIRNFDPWPVYYLIQRYGGNEAAHSLLLTLSTHFKGELGF